MRAGEQITVQVPIGSMLTVSGSAVGSVIRLTNPGNDPLTPAAYSGTTQTYGPYSEIALFRIVCNVGDIDYVVSAVNGAATSAKYNKTVIAGTRSTVYVPVGATLSVAANTGSSGSLVLIGNLGEPETPIPYSGAAVLLGPFTNIRIYRVICDVGSISIETLSLFGTPALPPELFSRITVLPTDATDMHADLIVGQTARFRVRDASLVTFDVSTAAQAAAVGAVKVMGLFRADGSLASYSTPLDYVTIDGLPYAKNNTAGVITRPMAASSLVAFTGPSGITAMLKSGGLGATSTAAVPLNVAYTGTTGKYYISVGTDRYLSPGARMNTGDALSTGGYAGALSGAATELFGMRFDHTTAIARYYRYGEVFFQRPATYGTPGTAMPNTPATAAEIRVAAGAVDGGSLVWASALNEADEAAALKWQKDACVKTLTISDGTLSWHGSQGLTHTKTGRTLIGFTSTTNGTVGGAEFDNTRKMTAVKLLVNNTKGFYWTIDDHNELNFIETNDGGFVAVAIGHGNGSPVGATDTLDMYYSATGYLDDIVRLGEWTDDKITLPNYCQRYCVGDVVGFVTNDDASISHLPVRHLDNGKTLAGWQAGRRLIAQTVPPGGGENQLYTKGVQDGNSFIIYSFSHSSNTQVRICRTVLDIITGDYTVNGVSVGNAWTDMSNTAPLVLQPNAPAIFTPAVGKSVRVTDATPTLVYGIQFNSADGTSGEHFVLSYNGSGDINSSDNWTYNALGDAGAANDVARRYFPSICHANDPHEGFKAYRQYESAGQSAAEILTASAVGGAITRTNLAPLAAAKQRTIWSPQNAQASLPVFWTEAALYTNYQVWKAKIIVGPAAT